MANSELNQYGSKEAERVQQEAFFSYAPAVEIYKFYLARSRPDPKAENYRSFSVDTIPERAEVILVERDDPLIDTTIALFGENEEGSRQIYLRWFPDNCQWPPEYRSPEGRVLHSLLSNRWHSLIDLQRYEEKWDEERGTSAIPGNYTLVSDERLISLLAGRDSPYLQAFCENPACLSELRRFNQPDSPYQKVPPITRLICLQHFSRNERFARVRQDSYHGPDFEIGTVHKLFLDAIKNAPKDRQSAALICSILESVPPRAAREAWVGDHVEGAAAAWEVDLPLDSEGEKKYWSNRSVGDGLAVTERIRFHIWRLYPDTEKISPNHSDKVRRLASYSTARMGKGRFRSTEKGMMRFEDLDKYVMKDGVDLRYAISYNPNIWMNNSEEGRSIESAVRTTLLTADERTYEELAWIIQRTISDEKLRRRETEKYRDRYFDDDDDEESQTPDLGGRLLIKTNTGLEQLRAELAERFAGWERVAIIIFFAWIAGLIWKRL